MEDLDICTISHDSVSELSPFVNDFDSFRVQLNEMGEKSALAQNLKRAITSFPKLQESNHQLFLGFHKDKLIGFLKIGVKHLFYLDKNGKSIEMDPLCVLDFYVEETFQRKGIGSSLFHVMLEKECVSAAKIAYDRPSPKLFAFLKRNYNLHMFEPQYTNYVVFREYFGSE